jgi:hydrogenase maturation protease
VIGVGSRGDDGAGVEVVRRLSGRLPPHARAVELGGDTTRLLPLFQSASRVVIIDAMRSGEPAGTVRRFDARQAALPARAFCGSSTHTIDIAAAIEPGRALGIPERIEVIGIEGLVRSSGHAIGGRLGDRSNGGALCAEHDVRYCAKRIRSCAS